MGRPTDYRPEFCALAIEHMAEGYSIAGLAGKLKVSRQTIYQWGEDHPEFSDALNEGRALSAQWWEDRLRSVAMGGDGNAAAAIFGLKNRAADEWREKVSIGGDADAPPIRTEEVGAGLRQLSALVAGIAERQSAVTDRDAGDAPAD